MKRRNTMAEKKIVKINGTTWELTPITVEDLARAEEAGLRVGDATWERAKYAGKCLEIPYPTFWFSEDYEGDIKRIFELIEKGYR